MRAPAQRRPGTRNHGSAPPASWRAVPCSLSSRRPVAVADPQARQRVRDETQPVRALEVVAPQVGLVAVHCREQAAAVVAAQRGLEFRRAAARQRSTSHCGGRPACTIVHAERGVVVQHRARLQPVEQSFAIRARRGSRCNAWSAGRRRDAAAREWRAGAGRGCRAPRPRRRRAAATRRSTSSERGPRLTRSPTNQRRSRAG